jgi:methanogenic corrinoid protein MtbC1
VKGIDYANLVKSIWEPNLNTSRQKTIKYLGNASNLTIEDIPKDYRNDPKIITFMASHATKDNTKKQALLQIKDEFFKTLSNGDINGAMRIYERYTMYYNLRDFYDNLLKQTMYEIGELWAKGKLDIATEHVCSNTAQSLIDIINEKNLKKYSNKAKILICTPSGELHSLARKVIESILMSKGFKVVNISPSVPAESVVSYVTDINPDIIFISITLEENIKAGRNLINKIRTNFSSILIFVGGIAITKNDRLDLDATILQSDSLRDIETELNSIIRNSIHKIKVK